MPQPTLRIMKHDPFAAILGTKRGRQKSDTILTRRPSKAAKEDLGTYLAELKEDNLDRTLKMLTDKHSLITQRPSSAWCKISL